MCRFFLPISYLYMTPSSHLLCSLLLSVTTSRLKDWIRGDKRSCLVSDCIRPDIGAMRSVVDLTKSSPQQTDVAHSTNEFLEAMSQPQPSFARDDDVDPTNESHTRKDSSGFPSSSFPSFSSSSSPHPSITTKHSSVLFQGVHDSHPLHHDATHLFQNLSLLDTTNPDTCKPMPRRKLPLSRLSTSSSRPGSKNEQKLKKSIKKKRTAVKFKYYRHPGAMVAITSAMEALDTHGDDSTNPAPVNGLDHSLVIRLKYKSPDTAATSTTDERKVNSSPVQHQHAGNRDIMRINSVLNNNPAQTMSSPPPPCLGSSITASNDDASPSSPPAPPLNTPDRPIEHNSTDILNHDTANDARSQFAKYGLQNEYINMLTHPDRQRYEDALVEIVGDLELPFFGDRFGSMSDT